MSMKRPCVMLIAYAQHACLVKKTSKIFMHFEGEKVTILRCIVKLIQRRLVTYVQELNPFCFVWVLQLPMGNFNDINSAGNEQISHDSPLPAAKGECICPH